MTLRIAAASIWLVLASCGPDISSSALLDASAAPDSTHLYLGKAKAGKATLVAAAPATTLSARYCLVQGAACGSWQDLEAMEGPSTYAFFGVQQFAMTAGARYRLELTMPTGDAKTREFTIAAVGAGSGSNVAWKAVFMSSDYQDNGKPIVAWDNGRRDLAKLLESRGFAAASTRQLSRDPEVQRNEHTGDGTYTGLKKAFAELTPGQNDRCFLFMTSHGTRSEFYVEGDKGITPTQFAALLDEACGTRPTVAFISACFAGIMVNQQTMKDNRIIFTAASADKTSQGCAPGIKYNLFEECAVGTLAKVKTFDAWGAEIKACIEAKDKSGPMFYVGAKMKGLAIDGSGSTGGSGGGTPVPGGSGGSGGGGGTPDPGNTAGQGGGAITGARNLALQGPNGTTDLKTALGASRYALVDFSAPSCGYCLKFAAEMENFKSYFESGACKSVTLVGRSQLDAWTRAAESSGAPSVKEHSFSLTQVSNGEALGALDGTGSSGSVPTPTILFLDTSSGKVIKKSVGALTGSDLRDLLGEYCK